ncbi:MAG: DUF2130 domain-containing protein, partial [Candidatus Kapaibacteriota bacterium]
VECPACRSRFSIADVLSDKVQKDIEERLRKQAIDEIQRTKEREIEKLKLEHQLEIENLKKELQEQYQTDIKKSAKAMSELLAQVENYRETLKKLEQELEESRKVELDLRKKELELKSKLEQEFQNRLSQELENIKSELDKKTKELEEARKLELELRRRETELFQKEQSLELEVQRRLNEERKQIQEITKQIITADYEHRFREKDEIIASMQKKIEELNFKLQVSSQQLQGEVQEIAIEEQLRLKFPFDSIEQVPKGVRGADIIQKVRNKFGEACGVILWESKRTTNWSNEWIPKLKEDQRELGAEFAVIVSRALPKEITSVGLLDGVWICSFDSFVGLAMALRENLIQVQHVKNSLIGRETKMEQIYNYICSEQFAQKVRAIV